MPSPRKHMTYRPKHIAEYLALRLVVGLIQVVPYRLLLSFGWFVAAISFALGRKRLESLAHGTLEAARVNGYDVDKIISSAKGVVLGRLYKEFYNAMNKEDTKTMDRMARQF